MRSLFRLIPSLPTPYAFSSRKFPQIRRGTANATVAGAVLFVLAASLLSATAAPLSAQAVSGASRWSPEKAQQWYSRQPWLVGSNYIPADADNELQMWQAATFDPKEIDNELGWAQSLGMNTMRVFLHDLLWQQDPAGFTHRIDVFLAIASRHHIRPIFVLFDSCWDPYPKLGPQLPPVPGVHNSRWVQSPGAAALADPAQQARLQKYVQGVVGAFAHDPRVLAWDVWNEPDNTNKASYGKTELKNKTSYVLALLPKAFAWARTAHPEQPLTSGVWGGNWSPDGRISPVARIQLKESDIVTFHNYSWPEDLEASIRKLETYHRPIICTEYMARGVGSLFDTVLPIAKRYDVGVINWGLVAGKTQTYLPWDSWQRPYVNIEPPVWFHDIFHSDGRLYRPYEGELIRKLTSEPTARGAE